MMIRALLASPVAQVAARARTGVFAVIVATAYGQIWLNSWNQPFYDALTRRDFRDFLVQLGVFFIIVAGLLVLNVAQRWLVETLKLKLREGLTRDLIRNWMSPRRAFWLANAGPIGVNPDQRMHEDARHLCELSADLGHRPAAGVGDARGLRRRALGHLPRLRAQVRGAQFRGARLYGLGRGHLCGIGSLLSYWVGGSLIGRNAERYAREADLRFALVRVNEHLDAIALAAGEEDERRRLETSLQGCSRPPGAWSRGSPISPGSPPVTAGSRSWRRSWWRRRCTSRGRLSFGGLMLAAAAFTTVQSSLRWFVDNFSNIADWRATLLRVANFRRAVITTDVMHEVESQIRYAEGKAGRIIIEGLEVASPAGCDMLRERKVEVRAGERVLIVGEPGTGKTLLFRALAGLWPLGTGRIAMPAGEQMLYFPRGTPYLPPGSLREVLAYPLNPEGFDARRLRAGAARLGLSSGWCRCSMSCDVGTAS